MQDCTVARIMFAFTKILIHNIHCPSPKRIFSMVCTNWKTGPDDSRSGQVQPEVMPVLALIYIPAESSITEICLHHKELQYIAVDHKQNFIPIESIEMDLKWQRRKFHLDALSQLAIAETQRAHVRTADLFFLVSKHLLVSPNVAPGTTSTLYLINYVGYFLWGGSVFGWGTDKNTQQLTILNRYQNHISLW